jgi:hypothetical protein
MWGVDGAIAGVGASLTAAGCMDAQGDQSRARLKKTLVCICLVAAGFIGCAATFAGSNPHVLFETQYRDKVCAVTSPLYNKTLATVWDFVRRRDFNKDLICQPGCNTLVKQVFQYTIFCLPSGNSSIF